MELTIEYSKTGFIFKTKGEMRAWIPKSVLEGLWRGDIPLYRITDEYIAIMSSPKDEHEDCILVVGGLKESRDDTKLHL